jgi:predicted nucleic acid-binding Zn finger protein
MVKASELRTLLRICREASETKSITDNDCNKLFAAFGQRFTKAWAAIQGKRVKKYVFKPSNRTVWIVVGKERDYLIMPAADFCSCDDFYFRVIDRNIHLCYHLIAQKIADTLGSFDLYEENDELYEALMREWREEIA